jgi:nitroreductase
MELDTAQADLLLSTTRAVRRRLDLDRPVEPEIILECLRLAVQSPTGGNRQGWRFVVVTDADKRAALAKIYSDLGSDYLRTAYETADEAQTKRVYGSAVYLADILHRVPVHVVACSEGRVDGAANVVSASFYGSILPAVWSFMLALRSRGLGSVWTTLHLREETEAAKLLGIPDNYSQVALIPVAYTVGRDFKPAQRPPVEEVTYWNGWGQSATP